MAASLAKDVSAITTLLRRLEGTSVDVASSLNLLVAEDFNVQKVLETIESELDLGDRSPADENKNSLAAKAFQGWIHRMSVPDWSRLLSKLITHRQRLDFRRRIFGQLGQQLQSIFKDGKRINDRLGDPIRY